MALPSFKSPPFLLGNYSHFGNDLLLSVSNGIWSNGGTPNDPESHSAVSHPFLIYDAHIVNNITRSGFWQDSQTGTITAYFEFMYDPGNDYAFPQDFIRLQVEASKLAVGPVNSGNPIYVSVKVITGQSGIAYSYPVYTVSSQVPPEAGVLINVGNKENGYADVNVQWNDVVNGEWFTYNINNYALDPNEAPFWRYHSRLNIEAWSNINVIEDYQLLTVNSALVVPGIPSAEAHGNHVVTVAQQKIIDLNGAGIPSEEEHGEFIVSVELEDIVVPSIPSAEAHGEFIVSNSTIIRSSVIPAEVPLEGDIRIVLDPFIGYGEFLLADRDVEREPGLENGVLMTLGTNREANPDDNLPDNSERGGWWGDAVPPEPNYKMGTRLWLLRRAKTNNELVNSSKEYLKEGFQWMIDDEVISQFYVDTWIVEDIRNTLGMLLGFLRPNIQTVYYKFYYNWEYELLRRV